MLTESDHKDIKDSLHTIEHVRDGMPSRLSFEAILAILDFILLGIKTNFFTEMGKPKNKLQLVMSIPAIVRFVREVIRRIHGDMRQPNRVKALSSEQKVAKAIEDGVASEAERRRIEQSRKTNKALSDPNGKKGAKD